MVPIFKKEAEVPWTEHHMVKEARLQHLYSQKNDGSEITVMKVQLPKGCSLPEHRHENQPDLIYPLKGKATMWIDGVGEFPLEPGMVVQVPKDTMHTIKNVTEELLLYNVFSPAIF